MACRPVRSWFDRRQLYGLPDPLVTLPFSYVSDRLRWRALGRYVWRSRTVHGWTRGREAVELARHAFEAPDHAVLVEIGAFLGCSTILMAGARKVRGSGKLHCIDRFDGSGDQFSMPIYRSIADADPRSLRDRFERNVQRAGLIDWVEVHTTDARRNVPVGLGRIDLLFLDGDQSYEAVVETFDTWSPHLQNGGVLALHNSRPGYRLEGHDGHARLAETRVHPPEYAVIGRSDSTTFARKLR